MPVSLEKASLYMPFFFLWNFMAFFYPRILKCMHKHSIELWVDSFNLWNMPGTWTFCYNACTWTNISWNDKIQRNYKELKNNCVIAGVRSWSKFWQRYKRTKMSKCHSGKSCEQKQGWGAKAGYCACPWTQQHKGVGKPPTSPGWPWTHPYLNLLN